MSFDKLIEKNYNSFYLSKQFNKYIISQQYYTILLF